MRGIEHVRSFKMHKQGLRTQILQRNDPQHTLMNRACAGVVSPDDYRRVTLTRQLSNHVRTRAPPPPPPPPPSIPLSFAPTLPSSHFTARLLQILEHLLLSAVQEGSAAHKGAEQATRLVEAVHVCEIHIVSVLRLRAAAPAPTDTAAETAGSPGKEAPQHTGSARSGARTVTPSACGDHARR